MRALKGKTGELGCTPHGTFFLQRLVEVVGEGGKGVAILLHEDVLASIGGLAFSEVSRLDEAESLPVLTAQPRRVRAWCRRWCVPAQ